MHASVISNSLPVSALHGLHGLRPSVRGLLSLYKNSAKTTAMALKMQLPSSNTGWMQQCRNAFAPRVMWHVWWHADCLWGLSLTLSRHLLQGHYPLFGTSTQYGKDSGAYPGNYNTWANVSTLLHAAPKLRCTQ